MISERDVLILRYLRNDARMSLAKIARKENIPISTLFSVVQELESNVINNSTTLIDFSKLGFNITVFGFLKADETTKQQLADLLMTHPNTNSLSKINNGYDFFIEAIFDNMASYTKFNEMLENMKLKEKKTMFSIEEIKKEDFLTREEHFDLFND